LPAESARLHTIESATALYQNTTLADIQILHESRAVVTDEYLSRPSATTHSFHEVKATPLTTGAAKTSMPKTLSNETFKVYNALSIKVCGCSAERKRAA
jgi:hypothetical protein